MKPRDLALNILSGPPPNSDPSRTVLDIAFQHAPSFDIRDRAFVGNLVQGVFRWRRRLDWIVESVSDVPFRKISPTVLNILRLALYQIYFMDRVPESASVNEAVNQAKASQPRHVVSFVNALLRRVCRQKQEIPFPSREADPAHFLGVYYAYPDWLVEKWIRELGKTFTEDLLQAQNKIPAMEVRTNRLKTDRAGLMERLAQEGIAGHPLSFSPEGLRLEGLRGPVDRLDSFQEGLFQVQTEAAQIPSHLLSPGAEDRILDLCAGLGGKTTHMAALTGERAKIIALDIHRGRLVNLLRNADRLGMHRILPLTADAEQDLSSLFRIRFNKILLDAPCSGLGVLASHPDGKWNRQEGGIRRLARLQRRILDRAASLLEAGGRMLYVTCTISWEENEGVVQGFLEARRDFEREDLREQAPPWAVGLIDETGFYRTYPNVHGLNGFFAALLKKTDG